MTSMRTTLAAAIGLIAFSTLLPLAQADSFGFYAAGAFQFDSSAISGNANGICSGECAPWGDNVFFDFSFSASVVNYQEALSCSNNECETEIRGTLGPGTFSAEVTVDDRPHVYYLSSSLLEGSFKSHFCTGQCGTYRPETELSLAFQGLWSNDWYSDGTVQLECFQKGGCTDGSGAGNLNTYVPEPSSLTLLIAGVPCLGCAVRRKLSSARVSGRRTVREELAESHIRMRVLGPLENPASVHNK
jgi:hypothetical protein